LDSIEIFAEQQYWFLFTGIIPVLYQMQQVRSILPEIEIEIGISIQIPSPLGGDRGEG
jgi:hypothetical protein